MRTMRTMKAALALAIFLAGCGAKDSPSKAPGSGVPAAEAPAGSAAALVGARSADWLLEPVAPLSPRGERVLVMDHTIGDLHGLVLGSVEGRPVFLLDRREALADDAVFVVIAALELPEGTAAEAVAWTCSVGGEPDDHVVGVVAGGPGCAPRERAASAAWRVDPAAKRFVPLPAAGVRCVSVTCEDEGGDPEEGVPGGVEGGAP